MSFSVFSVCDSCLQYFFTCWTWFITSASVEWTEHRLKATSS